MATKKPTTTPDPTELWDSVCTPHPDALKNFQRPGGFKGTAIDPMWVIRRATEVFGPVGIGFGWTVIQDETIGTKSPVHYCRIRLWYQLDDQRGEIESYGVTAWLDSRGRADDEAPKKSLTDAISKAMSYVGFGADVYMGMMDSSKYTTEALQEAPAPRNAGAQRQAPQPQQPRSDGLQGAGGPDQTCPDCGAPGDTMKYWQPGSRAPDLECTGGCEEEWNGKNRPSRWWSIPKGAPRNAAPSGPPPGREADPFEEQPMYQDDVPF